MASFGVLSLICNHNYEQGGSTYKISFGVLSLICNHNQCRSGDLTQKFWCAIINM